MGQQREWQNRIRRWMEELPNHIYQPIGDLAMEMYETKELLTPNEAGRKDFIPVKTGRLWGPQWGYGWFRAEVMPKVCQAGQTIVIKIDTGGESIVYINGEAKGAIDKKHTLIPLCQNEAWNERFEILVESYAGHGPHLENIGPTPPERQVVPTIDGLQIALGKSTYGFFDEVAYQLLLDLQVLTELVLKLPKRSLRAQKVEKALRDATIVIDFEQPFQERHDSFIKGREVLAPVLACHNGSTAPEMALIAQSHIDLAWMWPIEETKHKIGRTMATQTQLLKKYKDAKYLLCEPYLIEMLETYHPALFEEVSSLVAEGQIIPEGGVYIEGDSQMPFGEALIRQVTYGRRFFKKRFNIDSYLIWQPDVFGFSQALPQIYKSCGIRYFATQKLYNIYEGGDPFPYNFFMWKGLDGTEIFSHLYKRNNAPMTVNELITRWEQDRVQQDNIDQFLFPFGYGDGGGGPTREHYETACRVTDLEGVPRVKYMHPVNFFESVEKKGPHPVYRDELYYQAHRGVYTTQARTKYLNRRAQGALHALEKFAALTYMVNGTVYPKQKIENFWKTLLLAQFHDILPGTGIARVHKEAEEMLNKLISDCERETNELMQTQKIGEEGYCAFNSLSFPVKTIVTLPDGNQMPVSLAPLSFATLTPLQCACEAYAHDFVLENDYLKAEFDAYGRIRSLFDKKRKMQMASAPMNDFALYKDVTSHYDAWDINSMYEQLPIPLNEKAQMNVVCAKGYVASLRFYRSLNQSTICQTVSLAADSRVLKFETTVDWQEHHKLLKVRFPTVINTDTLLSEAQFGFIKRPTHTSRMYDADRFEVCQQNWSALCDEGIGLAVLNDSKHGVSAKEDTIALTLLKAPLVPDDKADRGTQVFTYALCLFDGKSHLDDVIAKGLVLNHPPVVKKGSFKPFEAFKIDQRNVILDTVKQADEDDRVIIRLYEACGKTGRVYLSTTLSIKALIPVNMMEESIDEPVLKGQDGLFEMNFRAFEIKTFNAVL